VDNIHGLISFQKLTGFVGGKWEKTANINFYYFISMRNKGIKGGLKWRNQEAKTKGANGHQL
jgi:hypothetical protein